MKRLLTVAAIVAASLVGCAPSYSQSINSMERPMEVVAETLVLECSQHGYIQATDETGMWILRYYMVNRKHHELTADFTPEEAVEYDRLRSGYNKLKALYLPEMCKSLITNAQKQDAEAAKHWKYVEK